MPTKLLKEQVNRNVSRFPQDFMFELTDLERSESEKAILMNIEIMRAFSRYRSLIKESEELKNQMGILDKKFTQAFNYLLKRLDELHQKKLHPRTRIGFRKDEL